MWSRSMAAALLGCVVLGTEAMGLSAETCLGCEASTANEGGMGDECYTVEVQLFGPIGGMHGNCVWDEGEGHCVSDTCDFELVVIWTVEESCECGEGSWCTRKVEPIPDEWECDETGQYCDSGDNRTGESVVCGGGRDILAGLGDAYFFITLNCSESSPQ